MHFSPFRDVKRCVTPLIRLSLIDTGNGYCTGDVIDGRGSERMNFLSLSDCDDRGHGIVCRH